MGGVRGVKHYMQRIAVQGSPDMITAISKVYQPGATGMTDGIHPFKKYFEELEYQEIKSSRQKDSSRKQILMRFADVSGDHFMRTYLKRNFNGTMFDRTSGTWLFHYECCRRFICRQL
jgi:oxepin-CoA hydrolase/3-oxo-5,6-dehydrosuberyl-CoA semialdehyde dehydrogenase